MDDPHGETATKAAAAIHMDFERGVIRAPAMSSLAFVGTGGGKGGKERGVV